jgi:hypothetical protein
MLAAMFLTSVVFTFRDSFEPPQQAGPESSDEPPLTS